MARSEAEDRSDGEAAVWPVLALLWSVSAVRVAGALYTGETFGWEATLASLAVLLGTVACVVWWWRRRHARSIEGTPPR
ncbi:MAG: hypothetical protein WKG00_28735 [Polyangiaceae bacterium]